MKSASEFRAELIDKVNLIEDPQEVIRFATNALVERLNVERCSIGQVDVEADKLLVLPDIARGVPSIQGEYTLSQFGPETIKASQREAYCIEDISKDFRTKDYKDVYDAIQVAAFINVPLLRSGHYIASLTVASKFPRKWSVEEMQLTKSVAESLWVVFEKAKLMGALQESEQKYRRLFDDSPIPTFIIDLETKKFIDVNPAAMNHYGFSREEFLAKTIYDVRPEEDISKFPDLSVELPKARRYRHIRKDGSVMDVEITASRTVIAGRATVIEMANDVTEKMHAEERIRASEEKARSAQIAAELANHAKSLFLANMSHEIRTPMNAILGFAALLKSQNALNTEMVEYIDRIQANGAHLMHLIDDILDISRVEAGGIQLKKTEFSVRELLSGVHESLNILVKSTKVRTRLEFEGDVPSSIFSDPFRFRQVLMNLIGNAAKFTSKGEIVIRANREGDFLNIDVIDTGRGISEDAKTKLFKHFSQGDESVTRKYGGTGLGLILSRKIGEALGGTLELVQSSEGEGAHFRFRHPIVHATVEKVPEPARKMAAPEERPSAPPSPRPLQGLKVLVVEDSPDNEALISAYMKRTGVKLQFAHNGKEAITKVTDRDHEDYDIILMDIQMPVMDGLEATRQLRRLGFKAPILALTAHALKEEINRSLEAGCDAHITKPIDQKFLIHSIEDWVNKNHGAR